MRSLSPSPHTSSSLIFQPQPTVHLFKVKDKLRKLKSSEFDKISAFPHEKKSSDMQPLVNIKTCKSSQGRFKGEELASTFGSDNFLNFRSKPLKRKKRRGSPVKSPNNNLFHEQSEFQGKEERAFQRKSPVKLTILGINKKKVYKISDFILLEKAGQGTYSEVYKAVEKSSGFVCSLKILNKEKMVNMGVLENLVREIKLSMFLNHPNLVSLYGCFSDKQAIYLIGQLATDHNLFDAMNLGKSQGCKCMPSEVVSCYMGQVCEALRYMHSHMILHRDVKPENILITYTTTIKLCDFGWSVHNPDRSLRNTFCGTPLYLAPQLIQQGLYDESADVWAVGVVTFELLTGDIPFRIRSIRDLSKVVTDDIRYDTIEDLSAVDFISKALQKQKQHRQTMAQICQHPFLAVSQSPPSI